MGDDQALDLVKRPSLGESNPDQVSQQHSGQGLNQSGSAMDEEENANDLQGYHASIPVLDFTAGSYGGASPSYMDLTAYSQVGISTMDTPGSMGEDD